jgi:hypothetical protein
MTSYSPTTWVEGLTKLGPTNLNHLENGVAGAYTYTNSKFTAIYDAVSGYGADPTGIVDATSALNLCISDALTAAVSGARAKILVPPGDYLISGPVTAQPTADLFTPVLVTGYGARLHLTTADSGMVFKPGAGHRWRFGCFEGFMALIDSNATTDAFLFTSSGAATSSENFWAWNARDLVVMTGTATAPINNGVSVVNADSVNVVFQYKITDCSCIQPNNVAGIGIKNLPQSGTLSSVEVQNPNTYGYLNGVTFGANGKAITGAAIIGGTTVGAYKEGVKMYIQGGGCYHTHVEGCWGVAPSSTTGLEGGELFIQGNGSIIELDPHVNSTTNQTVTPNAADQANTAVVAYATGGSINLIGRRVQTLNVTGAINSPDTPGLIQMTVVAHPWSTGDRIAIARVGGTTEANGQWIITKTGTDTFDLQGSTFAKTYTSGGTAARPFARIIPTTGSTTGSVNVVGIQSSAIDFSNVAAESTPTLNLWQPHTRTSPVFPGSGGSVNIDLSQGSVQLLTVTDTTAFTINNPQNAFPGCDLTLLILNSSGGTMGAVTFGSSYKTDAPFVVPGNGATRSMMFKGYVINGTQLLRETGRSISSMASVNIAFPPSSPTQMNSQKFVGLGAGTTNGDSVRYEQAVKVADTGVVTTAMLNAATVTDPQGFATGFLVPPSLAAGGTAIVATGSRSYVVRFRSPVTATITKIAVVTTVAATNNDNCDAGIFSSDGVTLLGSAGSTAGKMNATAGVQTLTLSGGGVALTAGTIYYAAFAYGTVGGTAASFIPVSNVSGLFVGIAGVTMPNVMQGIQSSAFPLAAPFSLTASSGSPTMALLY